VAGLIWRAVESIIDSHPDTVSDEIISMDLLLGIVTNSAYQMYTWVYVQ